jgi:hypothetical protein
LKFYCGFIHQLIDVFFEKEYFIATFANSLESRLKEGFWTFNKKEHIILICLFVYTKIDTSIPGKQLLLYRNVITDSLAVICLLPSFLPLHYHCVN